MNFDNYNPDLQPALYRRYFMTKLETMIAEIKDLDEKATPGEWRFSLDTPSSGFLHHKKEILGDKIYLLNGVLIAHYRSSAPKLAKVCEELLKVAECAKYSSPYSNTYEAYCEAMSKIEKIDDELMRFEE